MTDPTKLSEVDASSSPDHIETESSPKKVTLISDDMDEKHVAKPQTRRNNSTYSSSGRQVSEWEALQIVAAGDLETIDREIDEIDASLQQMNIQSTWYKPQLRLKDPKYFNWLLVGFASMGGLLSGIDQSLISGANLFMPTSLHLNTKQVSLVSSGVPLGAVGGALMLGPLNEAVGRRMAIIVSLVLYTVGAALEAGAINFGMMVAARVILGMGVGLEGGTVPVYVAESVSRKYRGNLVSLYQFMIALGEVLGYVVAAIFVNVSAGGWRYMLGSSLVFSTIMFVGILFMPESPRFLMHKGHTTEAWHVWKQIRGEDAEARKEFYVMKYSVAEEFAAKEQGVNKRFPWMDFFTQPRARRAIIYANIMVFLGQFTGINAIQYYMATLMQQVGFNDRESVFMSLVGGGALLLGTIPAIFYMEKFGRRFWACAMLPGFFIGLVLIGCSYLIPLSNKAGSQGLYISGLILRLPDVGHPVRGLPDVPALLRHGDVGRHALPVLLPRHVLLRRHAERHDQHRLALGFYGGIAVLGWFYQILFMPETKNKTLEEIDIIFSQPTGQLVRENLRSALVTAADFACFRWGKVFSPVSESDVFRKENGHKSELEPEAKHEELLV
ncbi:Proton myo-inositol cotransporter [Lachnellula willkommii]|uniref:Proton myo-inositol cotransporter n=1 Tax=Lachnellula willkommii TaxID=215461 RepID=A0A559MHM2_9HELO|nr:Proton myo-inositol cotransporter [Lachnellula willkommii]